MTIVPPTPAAIAPSPDRIAKALALLESVEVYESYRDRAAIARHEAGHAVMALELGAPVTSATIARNLAAGLEGACTITLWGAWCRVTEAPEIARLERSIMVLLAGELAERLAGEAPQFAAQDRARVEELLRCYPHELHDDERAALLAWCETHTRRRLARAWPAVVAIAMELLLADAIPGDRLLTLYQAALGAAPTLSHPRHAA